MSANPPQSVGRPSTKQLASLKPARFFYTGAAALMLLFAVVGFGPYYARGLAYPGREIAPPMTTVVAAHAVAMSAWLVLFLIQPLLIVRGNRRLHLTLGKVGVALAGIVVVVGVQVAIASAATTPSEARIWGLAPKPFMAVPFISVWIFATYVALGVAFRRKPDVHRPMMLLATLSALSAAVSRIDPLNALYLGTVWERLFGPFFLTLVFGVLLLVVRCALTRSFDRPFAVGLLALIVADVLILQIATTDAWDRFTTLLVS